MKTLITCGTPWCDVLAAQGTLESAGLSKARAASSGSVTSIDAWHERLFVSQPGVTKVMHPGKAWELAAGELFLANWDQAQWGWADSRSAWLLDFWRDFDPNTCFVLLHTPAYDVLASALANPDALAFDAQALLNTWCAYQSEFLRFYHRNRTRCVLTHAHQAQGQPAQWLAGINDALGTSLLAADGAGSPRPPVDAMVHLWVSTLLQGNPAVLALEDEIRATLAEGDYIQPPQVLDLAAAGLSWRALVQSNADLAAFFCSNSLHVGLLEDDIAQLSQNRVELEGAVQKGQHALGQQEALVLESVAHIARLDHVALQNLQVHQSLLQESDLSLQQLHQAQEDLEQHRSQGKQLGLQLKAVQLEKEVLTNDKAAAIAQGTADAQTQAQVLARSIAQSAQAAEQQDKALQSLQQESDLLLAQLHQVQEELEKHFLQGQQLGVQLKAAKLEQDTLSKDKTNAIAQRDAFSKDKTTLTAARDAETKAKTEAIAQRDAFSKDKTTLTAARDADAKAKTETLAQSGKVEQQQQKARHELQQESDLLLQQLHQVQEELESYFLQHQQVSQEKQQLLGRWNKLLRHYPDYAEWERIEVIPASAKHANETALRSQIFGLQSMGRSVGALDITVDLAGASPALLLTRPQPGAESPLAYWPGAVDNAAAFLRLDPAAPYASEAAGLLRSMALSDIQLVSVACTALTEGLPATLQGRALWLQHIAALRQQLTTLPAAWRFEGVELKHQQVNPDYENLWFRCTNASYGARHWPHFEFRLSASNVRRGKFSHLPKLEFPLQEQGDHQFENWFDEAEDDRGPKFELRFDTKKQAIDTALWEALSALDQAQALSLCEQLPTVLRRLQDQGVRIARPWSDWHTMALDTQKVLSSFVTQAAAMQDAMA